MGLLRGVARTAVVAGTATAVSGRVSRRQQGRWAAQEQAAAPEPPPPAAAPPPPSPSATDAKLDQLRKLGELKTSGVLTDAEFEAEKARVLNS